MCCEEYSSVVVDVEHIEENSVSCEQVSNLHVFPLVDDSNNFDIDIETITNEDTGNVKGSHRYDLDNYMRNYSEYEEGVSETKV